MISGEVMPVIGKWLNYMSRLHDGVDAILIADRHGTIEYSAMFSEQENGLAPLDAVLQATKSRIVPVAMASGTTILGMLPLLFDAMFGGMAACIMGGLLVASLLTIVVLPVTYCLIFRIKAD